MTIRIQTPTISGNWLYKDTTSTSRYFTNIVYLGKDAQPWQECTTAEKEAWESEHQPENIEES